MLQLVKVYVEQPQLTTRATHNNVYMALIIHFTDYLIMNAQMELEHNQNYTIIISLLRACME